MLSSQINWACFHSAHTHIDFGTFWANKAFFVFRPRSIVRFPQRFATPVTSAGTDDVVSTLFNRQIASVWEQLPMYRVLTRSN